MKHVLQQFASEKLVLFAWSLVIRDKLSLYQNASVTDTLKDAQSIDRSGFVLFFLLPDVW